MSLSAIKFLIVSLPWYNAQQGSAHTVFMLCAIHKIGGKESKKWDFYFIKILKKKTVKLKYCFLIYFLTHSRQNAEVEAELKLLLRAALTMRLIN